MKNPYKIDAKNFYRIGKYCFFIMAIMNLAGFIDKITLMSGIQIVSGVASIIWSFGLTGFFAYLLNNELKNSPMPTDEDVEKLVDEMIKWKKNIRN